VSPGVDAMIKGVVYDCTMLVSRYLQCILYEKGVACVGRLLRKHTQEVKGVGWSLEVKRCLLG
jgi:hypothetical protein